MDQTGGAFGGQRSESGIDWNKEYELSAKGYTFEDTQDYLDLNGGSFDELGFNDAFTRRAPMEDDYELDLNEAFTRRASVEDDYNYGYDYGDRANHFIPPRPPTVAPVPRKLPLPRKLPPSSSTSSSSAVPPIKPSSTFKAPSSMSKKSSSTTSYPSSSSSAAAAANKIPSSIYKRSPIKSTSSATTTTPVKSSSSLSLAAPKKVEKFLSPEETRKIKLNAGIAAFDRKVTSDLAKGRDPQLHKVPTFKKKESVLTLKEKRQAAVANLPAEPIEGHPDVIVIAFKLPSGTRVRRRFFKWDSLDLIKIFLWSIEEVSNKFEVGVTFPRRVLTLDPSDDVPVVPTFEEAGIGTNEMLYVIPAHGLLSP